MIANKNKNKPLIEDIIISGEKMNELNSELRLKSIKHTHRIIRKYAGAICTRCYNIPTKKITYDVGDAKLVERYCDKCFNDSIRNDGRHKKDIDKLN